MQICTLLVKRIKTIQIDTPDKFSRLPTPVKKMPIDFSSSSLPLSHPLSGVLDCTDDSC